MIKGNMKETKLNLVKSAQVKSATLEDSRKIKVPMAILAVHCPTTQEWPVRYLATDQYFAFDPQKAREIGMALLKAADDLENPRRHRCRQSRPPAFRSAWT